MKFGVMQSGAMSGKLGDIFWDLAPWITYAPGNDLGCNVYVANNTDTAKEYALMARLTQGTTVISDEAIPVYGAAWFKVEPGDMVTLKGAFRFPSSDADLTLSLVERESQAAADAVTAMLIAPSSNTLPPGWGGTGTPGTTGSDWSTMLGTMLPMLGIFMLGVVMSSAFKPEKETKKLPSGRST